MLSPNNLKDKVEPNDFILFRTGELKIFIHRELMINNEIEFSISSVGKFKILLEDNFLKENSNG